jgi:hypothetical protein
MAPQGCVLSLQVWVITQIVYDKSFGSHGQLMCC